MRAQTVSAQASAGGNSTSTIFVPDIHLNPFNVGFGAVVETTAHFTVQHTFDDIINITADQAVWFPHEFVVQASASIDGNYAFPVRGIRVMVSAANTGGVSVTFVQAGYAEG